MKRINRFINNYGKKIGFIILSTLLLTIFITGSIASAEDSNDPPLLDPVEIVSDGLYSPDEAQLPELELPDEFTMQDVPFDPNSRGSAQDNFSTGETGALHFRSGDVLLVAGLDAELETQYQQAMAAPSGKPQTVYIVVQYSGDPTPTQVAELDSWGYRELDYIPEQAFIVSVPIDKLDILARQPYIHAVVPMRPEWKYDSAQIDPYRFADRDTTFKVRLVAFEPLDPETNSLLVRIAGSLNYDAVLTPPQVQAYLNNPLIKWIEPQVEPTLGLGTSVDVMQIDDVWSYGLDGTGVSVGVIDTGINDTHAHFADTTLVFGKDWVDNDNNPIDCAGHGTHVAGTIGGSSTFNNQTLAGVAPEAILVIERIFDCNSIWKGGAFAAMFDEVANRGADVISNSWGSDTDGNYNSGASDTDTWARDNELVTLVFCNGNAPYYSDMWSPGIAKNVISVGATQDGSPETPNGGPPTLASAANIDLVAPLNDLGLPDDGRKKPDINAPGRWITSPNLGTSYTTWEGCSMATPHISGLIALYLDALPNSRSDRVKAALLNSAVYLGIKPDQTTFPQGYGRANALDFIYKMPGEAVDSRYVGEVSESQEQYANITVPSGAKYIKVTMTYLDKAGSTNANPTLVNNLDLRLESPSGTSYNSNSAINTVEQMRRNDPAAGTWKVYVKGTDIPGTDVKQKYAFQVSVVTESPSISVTKPASLTVTKNQNFSVDIKRQAADWFGYGIYSTVESLNSSVSLVAGQRSADVVGDMFSQSNTWSPVFVASSCGPFNDVIRIKSGGTYSTTLTSYVDVLVKPANFSKNSPSNGAVNQPTSLTLTWGVSSCATKYGYCIDTTNDNNCTTWYDNGSSTGKTFTNLTPGTTYYWHVLAQNDNGQTKSNGSSTAFWSFTTAAAQPCYTLTRSHTGSGSDPTASPGNSSGCAAGNYHSGELINLTASPASGWKVGSWNGTNNNTSTSTTNTVTMPAGTRTVTVNYLQENQTKLFRSQAAYDGYILESSEFSNKGGLIDPTNTIFVVGDSSTDKQYRSILSFNTAGLPDNAVITKVTLKLRRQGVVGSNPFFTHGNLLVDIRIGRFGSSAALQSSDFQAVASRNNIGVIPKTPLSGWYIKEWTSGIFPYINKVGLTQLRLRFTKDDNDDLGADYMSFFSADASLSSRPQLIIEYSVP